MTTVLSVAARHPFRMRACVLSVLAGAAMALGPGVASAVNYTGFTTACFGPQQCVPPNTPTDSSQSISFLGLTYNNSTFDVSSVGGFVSIGAFATPPTNFNNLGSVTLSGDPFVYTGSGTFFDIQVSFVLPNGTNPPNVVVFDTISGVVSSVDHGGVFIDLVNTPTHFTFDGGSFDFFVNDISITAGHTVAVTGTILDVTTAVPEPSTYALMFAGLGAMGVLAKRRWR